MGVPKIKNKTKKILIIGILAILISSTNISARKNDLKAQNDIDNETYNVKTDDESEITLTRYNGNKRPSIIMIHGMGVNHKTFDWDENHSLARSLNKENWDVWLLDLRTHDGDGDFKLGILPKIESDRERINRYWDFDKTYLKKDVVKAVEFVKNKTQQDKVFLGGHSYGGYLAIAYAEIIGEENLSGIITLGSSAMSLKEPYPARELLKYGIRIGKRAFVNPFGKNRLHAMPFIPDLIFEKFIDLINVSGIFYEDATPYYIKEKIRLVMDDEPAGAVVDMLFGKDPRFYSGHWVDPQTLYDYTDNLNKITVPFLAIAGDKDTDDPKDDVYRTFENISSVNKTFLCFEDHGHLDLLLGDNASSLIFSEISNWLDTFL